MLGAWGRVGSLGCDDDPDGDRNDGLQVETPPFLAALG